MTLPRRLGFVSVLAIAALALSACAGTVSMRPAPDANDPVCAEIMVRLDATLGGAERRWTDAQSTAAWGSPASILLTCGVTPPGPTTDPCVNQGGIDWVIVPSGEGADRRYLATTFGREPAVEVFINLAEIDPERVLKSLGGKIQAQTTATSTCIPRPS